MSDLPEQAVQSFPKGDYISPNFVLVKPDSSFPNMTLGAPGDSPWPYLRREIPHNWYVDRRYPQMGFLNRDEAHILYNTALQFQGMKALEIGCWLGWSACHLALAGVELDVIDPILQKPEFYESVSGSLKHANILDRVRLTPGGSPEKVHELAEASSGPWALIFIDGNHDAPGPLEDAKACELYAAEDALILFHDLASPDVAQGLAYLKQQGWQTRIYQTMQIMGVAWRGHVKPVDHQPDPTVRWQLPAHLWDCSTDPLPAVEPSLTHYQAELDRLRVTLQTTQAELWQLRGTKEWTDHHLNEIYAELEQSKLAFYKTEAEASLYQSQVQQYQGYLDQANSYIEQFKAELEQSQIQASHLQQQLQQAESQLVDFQAQLTSSQARMQRKQERIERLSNSLQQAKDEQKQLYERITAMESSKFWKARSAWMKIKRLTRPQ